MNFDWYEENKPEKEDEWGTMPLKPDHPAIYMPAKIEIETKCYAPYGIISPKKTPEERFNQIVDDKDEEIYNQDACPSLSEIKFGILVIPQGTTLTSTAVLKYLLLKENGKGPEDAIIFRREEEALKFIEKLIEQGTNRPAYRLFFA